MVLHCTASTVSARRLVRHVGVGQVIWLLRHPWHRGGRSSRATFEQQRALHRCDELRADWSWMYAELRHTIVSTGVCNPCMILQPHVATELRAAIVRSRLRTSERASRANAHSGVQPLRIKLRICHGTRASCMLHRLLPRAPERQSFQVRTT